MQKNQLSVREITENDIEFLINYWTSASTEFLKSMGAEPAKIPENIEFRKMLKSQLEKNYSEKASYCIIWLFDGKPVGHSNVNKIKFGEEAFMHLHLWKTEKRQQGMGTEFVKLCLPYFFKNLEIKRLFSEPYSLNPAPNKTLEKAGFKFIKSYTCIPGSINFEQEVNLWQLEVPDYR